MTDIQKTWYQTTLEREEWYKKDLAKVEALEHQVARLEAVNTSRAQRSDDLKKSYEDLDARADAATATHKARRAALDAEEARVRSLEAEVDRLRATAKRGAGASGPADPASR